MLDRMVASYVAEQGRKPRVKELVETLKKVLQSRINDIVDDADGYQLSDMSIRLSKRPKRQQIAPGDYFSVPLSSGGYGYGVIKKIFKTSIVLADFLYLYSDSPLTMDVVSRAPILFEALCGYLALAKWEWRVLGNLGSIDADVQLPTDDDLDRDICRLKKAIGPVNAVRRLENELYSAGMM